MGSDSIFDMSFSCLTSRKISKKALELHILCRWEGNPSYQATLHAGAWGPSPRPALKTQSSSPSLLLALSSHFQTCLGAAFTPHCMSNEHLHTFVVHAWCHLFQYLNNIGRVGPVTPVQCLHGNI